MSKGISRHHFSKGELVYWQEVWLWHLFVNTNGSIWMSSWPRDVLIHKNQETNWCLRTFSLPINRIWSFSHSIRNNMIFWNKHHNPVVLYQCFLFSQTSSRNIKCVRAEMNHASSTFSKKSKGLIVSWRRFSHNPIALVILI